MAADLLSTIRAEIDGRMNELRPLLAEYEGLLAAGDVLVAQGAHEIPGALERVQITRTPKRAPAKRKAAANDRKAAAPDSVDADAATGSSERPRTGAGRRGPLSGGAKAILAALEHGSHTAAELVVVTAQSDSEVRTNVRVLLARAAAVRISRQGKTAYALPSAA
jgi:hypothetical protein